MRPRHFSIFAIFVFRLLILREGSREMRRRVDLRQVWKLRSGSTHRSASGLPKRSRERLEYSTKLRIERTVFREASKAELLFREQFWQRDGQSFRNPSHNQKARISATPLDTPDIGQIYFGSEGQLLLGEPLLLAQLPNIISDDGSPIPHCHMRGLQAYSL